MKSQTRKLQMQVKHWKNEFESKNEQLIQMKIEIKRLDGSIVDINKNFETVKSELKDTNKKMETNQEIFEEKLLLKETQIRYATTQLNTSEEKLVLSKENIKTNQESFDKKLLQMEKQLLDITKQLSSTNEELVSSQGNIERQTSSFNDVLDKKDKNIKYAASEYCKIIKSLEEKNTYLENNFKDIQEKNKELENKYIKQNNENKTLAKDHKQAIKDLSVVFNKEKSEKIETRELLEDLNAKLEEANEALLDRINHLAEENTKLVQVVNENKLTMERKSVEAIESKTIQEANLKNFQKTVEEKEKLIIDLKLKNAKFVEIVNENNLTMERQNLESKTMQEVNFKNFQKTIEEKEKVIIDLELKNSTQAMEALMSGKKLKESVDKVCEKEKCTREMYITKQTEVDNLEQIITETQLELEKTKTSLYEATENLNSLQIAAEKSMKTDDVKENIKELEKGKDVLVQNVRDLKKNVKLKENTIAELLESDQVSNGEIVILQQMIAQLTKEIEMRQKEMEWQKDQASGFRKANEGLQTNLSSKYTEIGRLEEKIKDKVDIIQSLKSSLEDELTKKTNLTERLKDIAGQTNTVDAEQKNTDDEAEETNKEVRERILRDLQLDTEDGDLTDEDADLASTSSKRVSPPLHFEQTAKKPRLSSSSTTI